MASPNIQVNLLPTSAFEKSAAGRIIAWFFNIGKYLLIVIELIVIGAFVFRFFLDKKLTDINEGIKEKHQQLQAFGTLEQEFLALQGKIASLKKLDKEQLPFDQSLTAISQFIPSDIYLTKFSLNQEGLSLEALSLSEASLSTFLLGLQQSGQFEEIDLTSLTTEGSGKPEIKFSLTAGLKKG